MSFRSFFIFSYISSIIWINARIFTSGVLIKWVSFNYLIFINKKKILRMLNQRGWSTMSVALFFPYSHFIYKKEHSGCSNYLSQGKLLLIDSLGLIFQYAGWFLFQYEIVIGLNVQGFSLGSNSWSQLHWVRNCIAVL